MQLLCRYDITEFAAWKNTFDATSEKRRDAGLTLLQIWREVDRPTRVLVLFEVNDRDKAQAFLDAPPAEGVTGASHHFLETL